MSNLFHDLLTGSDLHANKIYPATSSELSSWTPTDGRYLKKSGDTMTGSLITAIFDHGGQVYSVKAYGAAGNGTTDDTAAIDAAVTAMGATPGILFFPPGTYKRTTQLNLPSNVTVCGAGRGATTLTTTAAGDNHNGLVVISNKDNITIQGLTFNATGANTAITSYGHNTLTIRDCGFTGTTTADEGIINLNGNLGTANMVNTVIEGNHFYDIPNTNRVVHLYPRNGNEVNSTKIINNHWENTHAHAIDLDAYAPLRGTLIAGNTFKDLTGGSNASTAGLAIYGIPSGGYYIENTIITHNHYANTNTSGSNEQYGFAWLYVAKNTIISDNVGLGSWTPSVPTQGPWLAPGRDSSPMIGLTVTNNIIEGFDAAWDPDSMHHVEVSHNIVRNCGAGWSLGYGTQEYVKIHHNTTYNSPNTIYGAGLIFANATPKKCEVSNNLIIDDRAIPTMTKAIELTDGHFDFSDVVVKDNRFYAPNATFSPAHLFAREFGNEVFPRVTEGNELHDATGISREFIYAQGNVTGATTFNRANGPIITATQTGNITVTMTAGSYKGQTLELRITTGGFSQTWPGNVKLAGGACAMTGTSILTIRFDGTNWVEVSRALNVS